MTNLWLTDVVHLILRDNVFHRLIRELQILLKRHGVFDLPEHNRRCDDQTDREQHPVGDEHTHVCDLFGIEVPGNGRSSGLYASERTLAS
jgi:hypothetical protein